MMQFCTQARKPCTRGLFESIECFLQFAHKRRMVRVLKTRWLLHVDFFIQEPMKKCIVYIYLSKMPAQDTTKDKSNQIVVGLTTGLKVYI